MTLQRIKHQMSDQFLTPQRFGAKGDGITDDSAAVLAWITAGLAANEAMVAPAGDYLLNSAVVLSAVSQRFPITGAGDGVTRFIVPATNTVGGIIITSSSRSGQARFSDFSIVRRGGGGVGLQYTQPEGGNQHQRGLVCERVSVGGENGTTDYFLTAFNFAGTWRPMVRDCRASGPFVGVTDAEASPRFSSDVGINLDGCYDATVDNCHVWASKSAVVNRQYEGAITGVASIGGGLVRFTTSTPHPFSVGLPITIAGTTNYNGAFTVSNPTATTFDVAATFVSSQTGTASSTAGSEAMRITNSILAECKTALVYRHPNAREPIIWFSGNHVNYRDNGLRIDGAKLVTITGNHIYNQDVTNLYSGTAIDVFLKNASEYIITGNTFHYDGATDRIAVFIESDTTGEGDNGVISSNILSGTFDYGVWLSANCTGAVVGPNIYSGTFGTGRVNDVSTSNNIVDGLAETSGTWVPALTFGGAAVGMTYGSRTGTYKIAGGLLHYQIAITLTAKGSSTGTADISLPTGLPGPQTIQAGGRGDMPEYANMATLTSPSARATSATNLRLVNQGAAAVANMTDANFTATSVFAVSGVVMLA